MSTYIIYETTNLINDKIYVGQHEIKPYTSVTDKYLGSGKIFKRALNKYGKENFKRTIIEFCTSANINEREIYWIAQLSATNKDIGYNIVRGGNGGNNIIWSDEKRKEFSEKRKGTMLGNKNPNYDNRWSDDQKERLRLKKLGHKQSEKTIAKRVTKTKGQKRSCECVNKNTEKLRKLKEENPDIFSSGKNTMWMNNGNINKRVKLKDICEYELKGFKKGLLEKSKQPSPSKGKIWINNGKKNKLIKSSDLKIFKKDGYVKGLIHYEKN